MDELAPIVERLMAALGVGGPADEYTQLLSQHVSGEGISSVGMDLIVRKLRERAPDPREFEARYQQLQRREYGALQRAGMENGASPAHLRACARSAHACDVCPQPFPIACTPSAHAACASSTGRSTCCRS